MRGFKHSGIFPSPHSLLSPSHPSAHPPLDLALVPNRGKKRRWVCTDALEVKSSMLVRLPWSEQVSRFLTSWLVDYDFIVVDIVINQVNGV